jgi:regulatory protein
MAFRMTATPSEVAPGFRRVVGAVVPDPRRAGSVRVLVEGRPLFTLAAEAVEAEGIGPGQVLDEGQFERLSAAADQEAALRTSFRLLERRSFAARDLARRLVQKGHAAEAAQAAVERAAGMGLVDDRAFTRHYIETRAARGRGPLRLRRDLAALGVERTIVDRTLAEVLGPDDGTYPDVESLARKRLVQLKGLPAPAQRRRLVAYLARRGYGGDAVRQMVGRLLRSGER